METLTAATIATLLVTKMVEVLGESLGEKIPDISHSVWERVTKLKDLLKNKSPETAAVLEAAENAPALIDKQPDVFGLSVLSQKLETIATVEPDIAVLINALDAEIRPQLSDVFQQNIQQQIMLKKIKTQTIKVQNLTQKANITSSQITQEMLVDVDADTIDLGDVSQT